MQALERAFHLAEQAPAGPVYLTVPREVMMAPLAEEPSRSRPTRRSRKSADRSNLARAVQMILDCQNPILLASRSGADPESVAALVNFCELAAIPVVETRHRMNFPHSHPLHLGFSANAFLPQADLVIMLDHHVPWIPNQWKPEAHCKIIQIDCDTQKSSIPIWGFPVDLSLESEAVEALTQLSEGLTRCLDQSGRRKVEERRQAVQSRHQELRARWKEDAISSSNDRPVSARWFFHRLNSFLDEQALVVCDAATNNPAAWKYLTLDRPGSFFQSLGSCLGWGLGAAIGAGLAAPERQIVAILGDGSWMFANPLAAYETAREQGVTFLTVVLNNTQYAAIVEAVCSVAPGGYARDSGNYPGCSLPSPGYYARIGQAAGLWTRCVLEPGEVNGVLREAFEVLNQGRSALVEVHVSANHGRS